MIASTLGITDATNQDSVKDWPKVLRKNAAICDLAKALFKARAEVYGGSQELTEQPSYVRERYIARADTLVQEMAPATVTNIREGAKS